MKNRFIAAIAAVFFAFAPAMAQVSISNLPAATTPLVHLREDVVQEKDRMVASCGEEKARLRHPQGEGRGTPLRPRGEGGGRATVEEKEEVVAMRPPKGSAGGKLALAALE